MGGLCGQPNDVAFDGFHVHRHRIKQLVDFSGTDMAFEFWVQGVEQLVVAEFVAAQVLVDFTVGCAGVACAQDGILNGQGVGQRHPAG